MANVNSTTRISSSTTIRQVRGYSQSSESGGFVEAIDTSNRVAIQARLDDERKKKKHDQESAGDEKDVSVDLAYVRSAIEALAASGVYDEEEVDQTRHNSRVNVYGNNQTIINREEEHEYPIDNVEESFFEEPNEDFDDFV